MQIAFFSEVEFNNIQTGGHTSLFVIFEILPNFEPIFGGEDMQIAKKTEDMLKGFVLAS